MTRRRTGRRASTGAVITGEAELMNRLNAMANDLKKDITKEALIAGAEIVKRAAESKAHGSVAQHIEIETIFVGQGLPKVLIGPDKDHWYAAFQEFGAKRHTIKIGAGKKILSDGSEVFGREVNHPGVTAKPFMRPAIDDNEAQVKAAMMAVIRRRLGVT